MRRDAVLVDQPEQRSRVAGERMMHAPAFFRNLDALQPLRESLCNVLLKEARLADAAVEALHRYRPAAKMRQHEWRDRLVIRGELALGDSVVREEHLFRVRDHGVSRTTSRAALSVR